MISNALHYLRGWIYAAIGAVFFSFAAIVFFEIQQYWLWKYSGPTSIFYYQSVNPVFYIPGDGLVMHSRVSFSDSAEMDWADRLMCDLGAGYYKHDDTSSGVPWRGPGSGIEGHYWLWRIKFPANAHCYSEHVIVASSRYGEYRQTVIGPPIITVNGVPHFSDMRPIPEPNPQ